MEQIKDLQEIQMEIKKELGGASLNHLLHYSSFLSLAEATTYVYYITDSKKGKLKTLKLNWTKSTKCIFDQHFILLNDQHQALKIFGQSEDFQRKLYDAIQIIKNINFNQ
jgi:hypothetical protein